MWKKNKTTSVKSLDDFESEEEYQKFLKLFHRNKKSDLILNTFAEKLSDESYLPNITDLLTITSMADGIENNDLRVKIYEKIIEELVLVIAKQQKW